MNESMESNIIYDREERAQELEDNFSYDGYQVVRKELFAHLRDPAVTVRNGSITFNTACIEGLEDVVYVQLLFNEDLKRMVVQGCEEDDKDALRWCIAKPDKRKTRRMNCRAFTDILYDIMGWDKKCRYKILGYRIQFNGETLYVFDFTVPETFHEKQKSMDVIAASDTETAAETKEIEPVNTRKGFYSDDIAHTFGVPVEEHRESTKFQEMDGFVSAGMLSWEQKKNE